MLDNRLKAAFELCRSGVVCADVGCDHAKLAAALVREKGCKVIASDIKKGPLDAAKKTLSRQGITDVRVVLSDGLDEIDFADDVIVCGMGGELIADIVCRCRFKTENTRFILQPMTRAKTLRERLYEAGFELILEKTAVEGGRVYSVMLWQYTGNCGKIDELFALTGKNRDRIYLEKQAKKLLKNAAAMEKSKERSDEAKRLRRTAFEITRLYENL